MKPSYYKVSISYLKETEKKVILWAGSSVCPFFLKRKKCKLPKKENWNLLRRFHIREKAGETWLSFELNHQSAGKSTSLI
jgi:hypothetical protein